MTPENATSATVRPSLRLLILGPPGAGKGTQAEQIAQARGIPHISTGDIFRSNIKNRTPLGKQVKDILDAGGYVPDGLTNDIVADRLREPDARSGFLLDGYPRTSAQVDALDAVLGEDGHRLDAVIELTVDTEVVVGRLLERARTEGRSDDTEDVIRERLDIYRRETAPLCDLYGARGLLVQVDGAGSIDEVRERVLKTLDAKTGSAAAS